MDRVNIKPTMSGIELIEGKSYILVINKGSGYNEYRKEISHSSNANWYFKTCYTNKSLLMFESNATSVKQNSYSSLKL